MKTLRIRVAKKNDKYILQVYDNSTGFNQTIKNYGPYKTSDGAFRGAKRFIQYFNYSIEQLDTEVATD